jgi:hypothetical protein
MPDLAAWANARAGGPRLATDGTSGNSGERIAGVTANARSLPALTCSIELARGSKVTCIEIKRPQRVIESSTGP